MEKSSCSDPILIRNIGFWVLVWLSLFFIVGCSSKLMRPQWAYQKNGIRVYVKSEHELCSYRNKAHTRYTCFYQLTDLKAFDQLTQDVAGIQKLLEAKLFHPSVVAVNSKILHPGEELTVILDRAENARYFAIVTGYYAQLDGERMVRRHKIQVQKKKVGFWGKKYQCTPCLFEIDLTLGAGQIEKSQVIENGCADECL